MKKLCKKVIPFVLSVALLLSCLPITALASDNSENENTINVANEESTNPTVISELTEKREANKKVFRLSDGTYMSAEYPQPVHFKQNGQWTDYDNTLIEEESEETNDKELVNSVSDIKVRLSKKTNGKKLVRIEKDEETRGRFSCLLQNYSYAQGGYGENSTTTLVDSVTRDGITTSYT